MLALNVSDNVALRYLRATLSVDFYKLAAESCRNLYKLAPRSLNVAKDVALLVFLADEWLNSRSALALT